MADKTKKNEADVLAENATLTETVATLTKERDAALALNQTASAQSATLTTERDAAQAQVTALTGERDQLKAKLTEGEGTVTKLTADNAKLTADMADFNKRVAAELTKRGIRPEASEVGAKPGLTVKPRSGKERLAEMRNN